MGVNVSNLALGPGVLYVAPFGSTEPLDSAITPNGVSTPPGSPWTDVGGTDGGVSFEVDTTYTDLTVDQIIMNVGSRLTELKMSVTTKMSEMTLGNLNTSLNGITQTGTGTGYQTQDIIVTASSSQPIYVSLIIDTWAPYLASGYPARRRIIVRKVLSQAKVSMMSDKKTQQSIEATWNAFYVSQSIAPAHLTDQQA